MKKSLLELYALAVCFAAIICFAVSSSIALYGIVQIVSPEFTMSGYEYKQYHSNDEYWQQHRYRYSPKGPELREKPAEDELTKEREKSYGVALFAEKRSGLQNTTKTAIIIMIDIVVFLIHWRIARQVRETNNTAQ